MRFETTELQGLQLYCSNKEIKDLETRFLTDKASRVTLPTATPVLWPHLSPVTVPRVEAQSQTYPNLHPGALAG